MNNPTEILLWKALQEPHPEPKASLTYNGVTYLIPYTLMHWINGWIAMGCRDSHAPVDAIRSVRNAFEQVEYQMGECAEALYGRKAQN